MKDHFFNSSQQVDSSKWVMGQPDPPWVQTGSVEKKVQDKKKVEKRPMTRGFTAGDGGKQQLSGLVLLFTIVQCHLIQQKKILLNKNSLSILKTIFKVLFRINGYFCYECVCKLTVMLDRMLVYLTISMHMRFFWVYNGGNGACT